MGRPLSDPNPHYRNPKPTTTTQTLKMHFSSIIIITTALIAASPTLAYDPCPGHTYPKCCGIDVLGIADVECNTPRVAPISFDLFEATCAQQGKGPKCCAIPVGGSALFCVDPVTSSNPSPAAPNNQNPLGGTPSPASNDSPSNGNPPDEGNPPSNETPAVMV